MSKIVIVKTARVEEIFKRIQLIQHQNAVLNPSDVRGLRLCNVERNKTNQTVIINEKALKKNVLSRVNCRKPEHV
jgi:hypothetical protein